MLITPKLSPILKFSPYEMVFKEKPPVTDEFQLEITRNQNGICTSSFCRYLPTHSNNTLADQNKIVQPLIWTSLSYTLRREKSILNIYSRQYLTIEERLMSKSELNHTFGKAYKLEKGTFVLYRNFKVNPKSSRKLQSLKIGPYKIKRATEVNYVSSGKNFICKQKSPNSILPLHPVSREIISNPHISISPLNPSENIYWPDRSPFDSLENPDEETTPDPKLIDNLRAPLDADLTSPLSFENSQQIPREPKNQKNNPQLNKIEPPTSPLDVISSQNLPNCQINDPQIDKIIPPTSQLDATSSQNPTFSQPRLTSRLHRQPVKDYRTNIPLSKNYYDPK